MYSLVEQWKQSDLTKAAFSALKSLSYHQFNYWLKKYNKEIDTEQVKPEVSFFSVPENPYKEKKQSVSKLTDCNTITHYVLVQPFWCNAAVYFI